MPDPATSPSSARLSFLAKLGAAIAIVAFADFLLFSSRLGAQMGVFALVWCAALGIARPAVRQTGAGKIALACAVIMALVLFDDPSLLATILFLAAIGSAALLPRHVFDHVGLWAVRLTVLALKGPFRLPDDFNRIARLSNRRADGFAARTVSLNILVPLVGGGLFLWLFSEANPVLASALGTVHVPGFGTSVAHVLFWVFVAALVWPTFRPKSLRLSSHREPFFARLPDLPVTTMLLAMVTFNGVFAIQNAFDIAFLWSGAPLPGSITLADYAHRGAYTLIATALLAALFVLVALRPDSAAAQNRRVRILVLVWVAQNILLVTSGMLRLFDYIDAYKLTELRIAALAWMALVGVGLALICWRFVTGRSARWLINANSLAALLVLGLASVVDLGAVAGSWNVSKMRDPSRLDLCYLNLLDDSALIPLLELRDKRIGPGMRDQVVYLGDVVHDQLKKKQSDWRSWTWRGARRLAKADALLAGDSRTASPAPHGRLCDGSKREPPPAPVIMHDTPPVETSRPLTPEAKQ